MIVLVWVFAIMWLITALVAIVIFELLQKALQENIAITIKANAPRVLSSHDDIICSLSYADGKSYDIKLKDIAIGGKSNA